MRSKTVLLGGDAGPIGGVPERPRRFIGSRAPTLRRCSALLAVLAIVGSAAAQKSVRLDFPDERSRDVWFATALPSGAPSAAINTKAKSIDLPIDEAGPKDSLFVWDRDSGNVAVKPLSQIKGVWSLKPTDFKLIGLVRVSVEHEGKPVAAAKVDLKDKSRNQTEVLDPTAKGIAEFYCVAPGNVTLLTTYRFAGKTQTPLKQIFSLDLVRSKPDVELAAAVPDAVDTVAETKPAPAESSSKPKEPAGKPAEKEEQRPNVFVQILFSSIILIGGAAGLYFLIQHLNKNSDKVRIQLNKLGVAIPDPSADAAGDAPPPRPAAPAPPERIILDAPVPGTSEATIMAAPPAPISTGVPRLVIDGGQTFDLVEGPNLVSREAGAPIAFVGDGSVSRRHAEVVRAGSAVTVRDLGSTNGTYVNGVKVVGDATLTPGDVVLFGTVRARYEA